MTITTPFLPDLWDHRGAPVKLPADLDMDDAVHELALLMVLSGELPREATVSERYTAVMGRVLRTGVDVVRDELEHAGRAKRVDARAEAERAAMLVGAERRGFNG